ncbi:hypothetical protein OOK58_12315 [Streptomyces sp. NBC_01728]|uniref:hypothetical protein n=1 Tax=unclassified Streptomyces TaxID=2593676 RepID=UPI00224D6836|nr:MULTISPECIES: hypothetical protein [unclassified Streptomyces]MCX4452869.1 hypothetical protein [Streptomyces sp. NBC_01719]MCX4492229.1 hypothetical protein [Streptomyces sp. NBC_01728]
MTATSADDGCGGWVVRVVGAGLNTGPDRRPTTPRRTIRQSRTQQRDTAPPYSYSFDTSRVPGGKHALSVEVTDTPGNTGGDSSQIITSNGDSGSTFNADFNGDGKSDVGVLYDYGQTSDGINHVGLWTYLSNGSGFNNPVKVWDNVDAGSG